MNANLHRDRAGLEREILFPEETPGLAGKLLRAAEGERERLARDIHDELAQELFAIRLLAESFSGLVPSDLACRAQQLADLAARAERTARALARSRTLNVGGETDFAGAVRELARRHEERVTFDLSALGSAPLDPAGTLHLHRLTQEAVTNAVRHGQASHIRITLQPGEPFWLLEITDNGTGFDPAGTPEGLGLRIMAYRASQLGGSLRLQRPAGGGMSVFCEFLPVSP